VQAVARSDLADTERVVVEATDGRGVDVALNGIGASIFPSLVAALADGGRMAVYGATFGGSAVSIDLLDFYRRRLQLIGVNTLAVDIENGARILSTLEPLFQSGALGAPHIAARYRLQDAVQAYARTASGQGKVVFIRS
jgi:NADPH:quinone reductase-like Zn-dependent oxidoreductase